jgi:hypothetical protein
MICNSHHVLAGYVFNLQNLTMTSVRGEGVEDLIFFRLGAGVNNPIAVGWCRKAMSQ